MRQAAEFDALAARARQLGLLSEAQLDAITDELAKGTRTCADLLGEWRARVAAAEGAPAAAAPRW